MTELTLGQQQTLDKYLSTYDKEAHFHDVIPSFTVEDLKEEYKKQGKDKSFYHLPIVEESTQIDLNWLLSFVPEEQKKEAVKIIFYYYHR